MPSLTTTYSLNKPLVNNATDQDLWGGYLNDNMDTIDTQMLLGRDFKKRAVTTTDSIVASDRHKIILCDATTGAFTETLLAAATAGDGFTVTIVKTDATAEAVTIDGSGAETIAGAATFVLSGQGDAATLVCDGVSNWNFQGNKTTPSAVAAATTTAAGIMEIATNAEAVTGTDTSRAVTPAGVKAAIDAGPPKVKAFLVYNFATSTIISSYNVGSVVKNATGNLTITFTTAMDDDDYAVSGASNNSNNTILQVISATTTTLQVQAKITNASGNADITRQSIIVINT